MQTVGPNGAVLWEYPETEEANIEKFNAYINGTKGAELIPTARSVPISELTGAAGEHVVEIAPENAMGEAPKASVRFQLVTGVPLAVTNVRVA